MSILMFYKGYKTYVKPSKNYLFYKLVCVSVKLCLKNWSFDDNKFWLQAIIISN